MDGARVAAIAAPNAEIFIEFGHGARQTRFLHHAQGSGGALFGAGPAMDTLDNGDAPRFVEDGQSDTASLLLFERERTNRPCRANLRTVVAVEFAHCARVVEVDKWIF